MISILELDMNAMQAAWCVEGTGELCRHIGSMIDVTLRHTSVKENYAVLLACFISVHSDVLVVVSAIADNPPPPSPATKKKSISAFTCLQEAVSVYLPVRQTPRPDRAHHVTTRHRSRHSDCQCRLLPLGGVADLGSDIL